MNDFDYTPDNQSEFASSVFSQPEQPQKNNAKGPAIAALVFSILALVFACACCTYFVSAVFIVLAIVFSFVARKKNNGSMPAMAITALILAIVALLIFLLVLCVDIYFSSMSPEELNAWLEDLTGMNMEDIFADMDAEYFPLKRLQ